MAVRREPIAPGGRAPGYEPLVFDRPLSRSWLCNGLETDAVRELGAELNENGHIGNAEDANRFAEWVNAGGVGAGSGPWLPPLLVEYSFASSP